MLVGSSHPGHPVVQWWRHLAGHGCLPVFRDEDLPLGKLQVSHLLSGHIVLQLVLRKTDTWVFVALSPPPGSSRLSQASLTLIHSGLCSVFPMFLASFPIS